MKFLTIFILFVCSNSNLFSQKYCNFKLEVFDNSNMFDCVDVNEAFYKKTYQYSIILDKQYIQSTKSLIVTGLIQYPTGYRVFGESKGNKLNELIFIDTGYQSYKIEVIDSKTKLINVKSSLVQKEYIGLLRELNMAIYEDKIDLDKFYTYVLSHNKSYVVLYFLLDKVFFNGINEYWLKVYKALDKKLHETNASFDFSKKYITQGKVSPIELINKNGIKEIISLNAGAKVKKKLVLFWFAACEPCIIEMKQLNENYPYFNSEIISICTDTFSKNSDAVKILKKYKIKWNNYWDPNGSAFKKYITLYSYPSNIVIDNEGVIIGKHVDVHQIL